MKALSGESYFPSEPWIQLGDLRLFPQTSWDEIDARASTILGRSCLGIPSVRVGMCWVFDYLEFSRHRDHVLVPRFLGRCVLNALNRYALPVQRPTPETKAVVVVDQFGLKQDCSAISAECVARGYVYLEDSPYGLGETEKPGPGSIARLVGLTKVLPIVQGGLLISDDEGLLRFVKKKRSESSHWSWMVWSVMALLRCRRRAADHSAVAEAAYEMYWEGKGGNAWLRGNMSRVLDQAERIAGSQAKRMAFVASRLGDRVVIPDLKRFGYVMPFLPGDQLELVRSLFEREGFDAESYHVDIGRNLFAPQYLKALLIPLNPRIPQQTFERLVSGLEVLVKETSAQTTMARDTGAPAYVGSR